MGAGGWWRQRWYKQKKRKKSVRFKAPDRPNTSDVFTDIHAMLHDFSCSQSHVFNVLYFESLFHLRHFFFDFFYTAFHSAHSVFHCALDCFLVQYDFLLVHIIYMHLIYIYFSVMKYIYSNVYILCPKIIYISYDNI